MNSDSQTPTLTLSPQPLTKSNFSLYGEVIEAADTANNHMNSGTFARFDNLASVTSPANCSEAPTISMVRSQKPAVLPYEFSLVEKHPLCSQAFIPLNHTIFYVVVGRAGDSIAASDLQAFVTNGQQGISYFPGTWHMPLISLAEGQSFLVVDQAALPGNLVEVHLPQTVTLTAQP